MSIVYQYLCSTENVIVLETKDKDLPAPTVCINEGSAIVADTLSISRQPTTFESGIVSAAGEFDFNDCAITELSHTKLSDIGTNTHAQIDTHISDVSNPHTVTKAQIGLSEVDNLKVNLTAVVAPVSTDDSAAGYGVGSRWVDTVTDKIYVCVDATANTAIWSEITGLINVDIQEASSTDPASTTSPTYIDLPNASLTTSNTSSTTYNITFSADLELDTANESISIIINVDGADISTTERSVDIEHISSRITMSTNGLSQNLTNGKIIKIRYKCSAGTVTVHNRNLTIHGIY